MSKLASEGQNLRKETEKFGRGEGEFLIKKGYEKGGGSL
ncbi:glycosyltransferase [Capnocytophaga ochracea]|nr:glycosyltransferase [Capnocytophaga ochracea]